MILPFAEWLPDLGELTSGSPVAKNVLSQSDFYVPFREMEPLYSALPLRCLGAWGFRGLNNTVETIVGTAEKLYRGNVAAGAFDWSEIGAGYGVAELEFDYWTATQWQNRALLTNYTDPIQQYTLGTGGPTTDLVSTIRAKYIADARDFILVGNVNDEDGVNPTRVRWCAYRNPDDWVPDVDTQAGFKDLEGRGGAVRQVLGGEIPIILREEAVHRFVFEGGGTVWQNDKFLDGIGTPAPRSAVRAGEDVLFLSESGFIRLEAGVRPVPIGEDKVDSTFYRTVRNEYLPAVQGQYLPRTKVVIWSFSTQPSPLPDTHYIYNLVTDRWTFVEVDLEMFFTGSSPSYTLEDLDLVSPDTGQPTGGLDGLPASLDSRVWVGDLGLILAFDRGNIAGQIEGPPMTATLSTGEFSPFDGWRFSPKNLRPIIHSGQDFESMEVWVEHHNVEWKPHQVTSPKPPNALGFVPFRLESRYQRYFAQFKFPDEFQAKGVSIDFVQGGFR